MLGGQSLGFSRVSSPSVSPWLFGGKQPAPSVLLTPHVDSPDCELTGSTRSYTFKVDEDDDSEHILALSMVCLTDGAKDECNVVEVVGRNRQNQEIAVPVANLKLSCQPTLSLDNFQLQPPVTFHLKSGSGPVHLSGRHQISKEAPSEEEESAEEEEEELIPVMPAKKQRRRQ
uniref:Nucleoplasmin-3 n=1 Tax=Chelonoidis abingdonii TaxID=106734 RepID=A0A8C0G3H3_CHEAB